MSNISNINKCKVSKDEAWMDFIPNLSQIEPSESTEIFLGIDSGSTFTRFISFDNTTCELANFHQINSDAIDVRNMEHIHSASKSLYSNLEFIVNDITLPSKKPEKLFNEAHFVKGDLTVGLSGSVIERSSRMSKTEIKSTYYNIIAAITLEVIDSLNHGKKLHNCYRTHLAMTMPPKDFKSKKTLDIFKSKLCGHYSVYMPRIGLRIHILIEDDIFFENEPTAIIYSLANNESDDIERSILDKTAIIVDGGGGTTDKAVVINGQLVDEQAETGEFGGKMLLESIARIYQSETGRTKPALSNVEESLDNGILIRGNSKVDIFDYIKSAKESTAQAIFNDLSSMCDNMNKSLDDIEEIILHGRLFRTTITPDGRETSIANILNAKLKEIAPDIKVSLLTEDNYVCEGAITSLWVSSY